MLNILGMSLSISSIFAGMSPTGATVNGNLPNMYVPNGHANVDKYKDFLIKFQVMVS